MEIRNAIDLRNAHPDLVTEIENAARAAGAAAERQRIQEIEEIQNVVGDAQLVRDAKFGEKPMNNAELLVAAAKKHAAAGTTMFNNMVADTNASGVPGVTGSPAAPENPKNKTDDEQAEELLLNAVKNMKEGK